MDELVKAMKFCPMCGKELEVHPYMKTKSCFVDGDFLTMMVDEKERLVFQPIVIGKD